MGSGLTLKTRSTALFGHPQMSTYPPTWPVVRPVDRLSAPSDRTPAKGRTNSGQVKSAGCPVRALESSR